MANSIAVSAHSIKLDGRDGCEFQSGTHERHRHPQRAL